ncbi:hypothetical protein AOY38_15010 [Synechocystis sp. PCC 6803]|nr:hypothetical protein AOY38_15010 [Synechocystis sp. PCC 6803]AVP90895.1 hypothetical protein C7I86_15145 [Synechocystis sp. IPPAS B-1465]BAM53538.1 hypothetical protein BEST7613_4607 [Synechocystis sp. PCC 6803] [Bacillus subtilis BEST7613]
MVAQTKAEQDNQGCQAGEYNAQKYFFVITPQWIHGEIFSLLNNPFRLVRVAGRRSLGNKINDSILLFKIGMS